jgi:Family of unknown function (DUF6176)
MAFTTELETFAVKPGAESRVDEWMAMLEAKRQEVVKTLDREHMHVETIFKSTRNGRTFLTWYSIQGNQGAHVRSSPFEVDRLHLEYWRECIDESVPPERFIHVLDFLPASVEAAIALRESALQNPTEPLASK